jgi:hypothetical protein
LTRQWEASTWRSFWDFQLQQISRTLCSSINQSTVLMGWLHLLTAPHLLEELPQGLAKIVQRKRIKAINSHGVHCRRLSVPMAWTAMAIATAPAMINQSMAMG